MTPLIHDPVELRARGFQVLVDALGWVNAVRFIQSETLVARTRGRADGSPR